MSTTNILAAEMLEVLRGKATHIGLLRALPDKDGQGGEEVIESSYARQAVSFGQPENSVIRNSDRVDFPLALTDWGTVVAFGIWDAESGGNMLWFDALESSPPIPIGSRFFVYVDGLELSVGLT